MEIIQVNPADKKQVQAFLNLPFHIYKNTLRIQDDFLLLLVPGRTNIFRTTSR